MMRVRFSLGSLDNKQLLSINTHNHSERSYEQSTCIQGAN